jgi:Phage-related minor tail protein
MAETTGTINLIGKDQGLTKVLDAGGRSFEKLNERLTKGVENLTEYREGMTLTEKALKAASKSAEKTGTTIGKAFSGAGDAYDGVTKNAERTIDVAEALDNRFAGLAARALGINRPFSAFNSVLQPMAGFFGEVADQTTAFGKAAVILNEVSTPIVGTLTTASDATESFAERLSQMGAIGAAVSTKLVQLSNALGVTAQALGMADKVGDLYLLLDGIRQFAVENGPMAIETARALGDMYQQMGVQTMLFGDAMKTATTAAYALKFTTQGFAKEAATLFLQFKDLNETVGVFVKLGQAAGTAYLSFQNLNEAFSVFDEMGLDTTAAKIGVELANLNVAFLTNAESAQQFMNVAVSAFAQLEDQLAFVQTLGAGASVSMDELSGSMQNLVNGPLRNTISSVDAANSLYNTLSAGVGVAADGTAKLSEATGFMSAGLKLAAGTGTSTSQTMEVLAKVTSAYALSNRDAATTAAKLNAVVETGIVTFPQLTGGLARVAGVAKSSGVSIDEFLGSVSALTVTMTADDAMTGYASLLQSIAGQGRQAQEAVEQLGIRFDSQRVKTDGLLVALNDLFRATGGSTQKLKEIIPDALAFQTALTLMTSASQNAAKFTGAVGESGAESLDKLFGKRQQSLVKETTALMNGFNEVMIDFGKRLEPVLVPAVQFLQNALDFLQGMPEPLKNAIAGIVLLNMTVGKAAGAFQNFTGILTGVATQYLMLRALSLTVSGQIVQEVAAVRELVAVRKDWAGALLQIFGVQQDVVQSTKAQIALQQSQARSQQVLNELFGTTSKQLENNVGAYQEALVKIQEMKEQTRSMSREELVAAGLPSQRKLNNAEKEVSKTVELLGNAQNEAVQRVASETAESLIDGVPEKLEQGKSRIGKAFDRMFEGANIAGAKLESLRIQMADAVESLFEVSESRVADRGAVLKQTFSDVFDQMGDGITSKKEDLMSAVSTLIDDTGRPLDERRGEFSRKIDDLFQGDDTATRQKAEQLKQYVDEMVSTADAIATGDSRVASSKTAATAATNAATTATVANTKATQANAANQGLLAKANAALTKQRIFGNQQAANELLMSKAKIVQSKLAIIQTNLAAAATAMLGQVNIGAAIKESALATAIATKTASLQASIASSKLGVAATALWTKVSGGAAVATNVLTGALRLATAGLKSLWVAFGPLAVAIGAAVAGFMALQDVIPAFGGAAGEMQRLASATDAVGQSADTASKKVDELSGKTQEYSGFINSKVLPTLKSIGNFGLDFIDRTVGGFTGLDKGVEANNKAFKKLQDTVQAFQEVPVWEAIERTDKAIQDLTQNTLNNASKLQSGGVITQDAQEILNFAKEQQRALTGDELRTLLAKESEAVKANVKTNDEKIAQLEELKNSTKDPEFQAVYQEQINAITRVTSAEEEALKKRDKFITNLNTTANAIDANNAARSTEAFRDNLKKQMEEALTSVPKEMQEQYKQLFKTIDKNVNTTSASQRRAGVKLVTATRNFVDNVGKASDIQSQEELEKMRNDVDSLLENINASEALDGLSRDVANQLRQDIMNQEINIPSLNIKGSILSADQIERLNQDIRNSFLVAGETSAQQYELSAKKIETMQQQRVLSEQDASVRIQQLNIDAGVTRIAAERKVLDNLKETQGEQSQAYKDQLLKVEQLEQESNQRRAGLAETFYQQQIARDQRMAENAAARTTVDLSQQSNDLGNQNALLEQQRGLMGSYQEVVSATASLEQSRLSVQKQLTTDAVERAQIDTRMAEQRAKTLEQTQTQERLSLEIQNQMNVAAARQQVIQNQIAVAENQRAITLAKIELRTAQREKRTKEEIDSIQIQIQELENASTQLEVNAGLLAQNEKNQAKINANAKAELAIRQQQAREETGLDVRLSQQQEILSMLEREQQILQRNANIEDARLQNQQRLTTDTARQAQLEQQAAEQRLARLGEEQALARQILEARNASDFDRRELAVAQMLERESAELDVQLAREQSITAEIEQRNNLRIQQLELIAQKETQIQDMITKSGELQSKALESRKSALDAGQRYIESEAQILMETTKNQREKKKIAEDLARFQHRMLLQQQELERQNLELQIQQNQLALERQKIETRTAQVRNAAEVEMAAAEEERIRDRYERGLATDRELSAAQMKTQAEISEGAGLAFTQILLDRQSQLDEFSAQQQRRMLSMGQETAADQSLLNVANNTRNRGQANRIRRSLAADARDTLYGPDRRGRFGAGMQMPQMPVMELPDPQQFMEQYQRQMSARMTEFVGPGLTSGFGDRQKPQVEAPELVQSMDGLKDAVSTLDKTVSRRDEDKPQQDRAVTIQNIEFNMTFSGSADQSTSDQARQGVQEGLRKILEEAARRK